MKKRPAHRPRELKDGRRVNVFLDEETREKAESLGGGNVSEGIRIAVKQAKVKKTAS